MARILLAILILYSFGQVHCQIIRSPLSLLNRPLTEIYEPRSFIEAPRTFTEVPRNFIEVPRVIESPRYIENVPFNQNVPSTTIISDCTPSVCKNLANTINLMIVCGLLQNSKTNEEVAIQFAAPLLREIISNPTGAIASTTTVSSLLNANAIPNFAGLAPNYIPNLIPSNFVPNNIGSNLIPNSANNAVLISNLLKLLGGGV